MKEKMSNGSAWKKMRTMSIADLNAIAGRMGYGFEEEMARSFLRIRLHGELQALRASPKSIE